MGCPRQGYLDVGEYFFADEVQMLKVIKIQDLHINGLGASLLPITNLGNDLIGCSAQTICAEFGYFATNLLGPLFNFCSVRPTYGCLCNADWLSLRVFVPIRR